ncbi:D-alanyl-D-alanine carboxypeptidase [Hoeflea poritis]|uniref:D-alanyl-D-alanine carboxypeptidase n=1 Tax=Hoeflea poritis TaxID=2993659 RepID=A0ABT4VSV3_9HYPH|nr:D-alanyl-D-alanine carboxypeptidase [Hoeflea poritis]MDA4847769.1 D-alanyl-D-alanine carboxypeptidase [Hoeflea poritis]
MYRASFGSFGSVQTKNSLAKTIRLLAAALLVIVAGASGAAANPKYAGFVIDAKTGKTLYASNANSLRYPASLTKMMTLYMVFEALDSGRISKKTRIRVSKNAAAEPPSKLGLKPGQTISVEQAIYALVTKSANDASTAVAEHLGGSESGFARQMTTKARALGMKRTTFRNAHGLPNSGQKTTARDMARLGLALREHFPHHYHYFSTRSFKYGKTRFGNHNRLLGTVSGVDGIKTGYTRASGFNLVSSVRKDGRSIVAVVMGGKSGASRNKHMTDLISRYLKKASRKGGGNLIAKGPATTRIVLPKKGPVPKFRDVTEVRVAMAYAKPQKTSSFPIPLDKPVVGKDALIASLNKQRSVVAPVPRPKEPVGAQADIAQTSSSTVDAVTTSSTGQPSGWVVQIGATPTRQAAEQLLAEAKAKTGGMINSAQPFTIVTHRDGEQLHRARFAGFDGKSHAWKACKALKKKGYGCWATQQ